MLAFPGSDTDCPRDKWGNFLEPRCRVKIRWFVMYIFSFGVGAETLYSGEDNIPHTVIPPVRWLTTGLCRNLWQSWDRFWWRRYLHIVPVPARGSLRRRCWCLLCGCSLRWYRAVLALRSPGDPRCVSDSRGVAATGPGVAFLRCVLVRRHGRYRVALWCRYRRPTARRRFSELFRRPGERHKWPTLVVSGNFWFEWSDWNVARPLFVWLGVRSSWLRRAAAWATSHWNELAMGL